MRIFIVVVVAVVLTMLSAFVVKAEDANIQSVSLEELKQAEAERLNALKVYQLQMELKQIQAEIKKREGKELKKKEKREDN